MVEVDWNGLEGEFAGTPSALTIGVFDGLHSGHRLLIHRVVESPWMAAVVTFQRHPSEVLLHDRVPGFIMSLTQKRQTLRELGVDVSVEIDFNEAFRRMPGRDFLDALRANFALKRIVVGHDFRCGYGLDTDAETIRDHFSGEDVEVISVEPVEHKERPISSTRIRQLILNGRLDEAQRLLGRPYAVDLSDEVVEVRDARAFLAKSERGLLLGSSQLLPPPGTYRAHGRNHPVPFDGSETAGDTGGPEFDLEIGENSLGWPLAAGDSIRYIVIKERRF